MEILSFTYLIIDILCLISLGFGFFGNINSHEFKTTLKIIGTVGLILYPFIYEPFLKLIYISLEKLCNGKANHAEIHLNFAKTNNIIFNKAYNISILGIEKKHPFDARKSENVTKHLCKLFKKKSPTKNFTPPEDPNYKFIYSNTSLLHLIFLNYSVYITKIAEIPLFFLPSSILRIMALRRFLLMNQGSLNGSCLAIEKKFAINLGGGFHHAHSQGASGFCFYNDIGLIFKHLWKFHGDIVKKILVVDLDAHQGNGHARDKIRFGKDNVVILDMYNPRIFPGDGFAKSGIDIEILVGRNDDDEAYLDKLQSGLERVREFGKIDFIVYNAGTDILQGDSLGKLSISEDGVVRRDEKVFRFAREINVPLLMLLSGGYQKNNALVIAKSIFNLDKKFNIF